MEAEEGRIRGEEAAGNRHAVVEVEVEVAAVGKHRDEAAAEGEAGAHRDVVVVGGRHDAAAAAHTCRKGEGVGSAASARVEEAGKDECRSQCDSHAQAFQSDGEGRRGAYHLADEDEVLVREAHEASEAVVHLHRLTTPRP